MAHVNRRRLANGKSADLEAELLDVIAAPDSPATSARAASTSSRSCHETTPASSSSGSCATVTGAARRHESSDGPSAAIARRIGLRPCR